MSAMGAVVSQRHSPMASYAACPMAALGAVESPPVHFDPGKQKSNFIGGRTPRFPLSGRNSETVVRSQGTSSRRQLELPPSIMLPGRSIRRRMGQRLRSLLVRPVVSGVVLIVLGLTALAVYLFVHAGRTPDRITRPPPPPPPSAPVPPPPPQRPARPQIVAEMARLDHVARTTSAQY